MSCADHNEMKCVPAVAPQSSETELAGSDLAVETVEGGALEE